MMQFFCFLLLLGISTNGHTQIKKEKKPKNNSSSSITIINNEEMSHAEKYNRFATAGVLQVQRKFKEAEKALTPIIQHQSSPYVYESLIRLHFDQGNLLAIANLAQQKKLEPLFKDNLEVLLMIAQAYQSTGQEKKSESLFEQLKNKYPNNDQVAYYFAIFLIQKNKLQDGLDHLSKVLENKTLKSRHFLFLFLQSKIFMMQNDPQKALASIEKSLELFPKFDRGLLMKSLLLEQMGRINQAIDGYEKFLGVVGREPNIEKQLIQLFFSQQQYAKAGTYLKKMKSNTPEYFFDLALISLKLNDYPDALSNINQCLEKKPDFEKAKLLKLEILLLLNDSKQILNFVQSWLIEDPNNNNLLQTITLLRSKRLKTDDVITLLQNVISQKKESLTLLTYLGNLYQETKNYEKSIKTFEQALALAPSRSAIKSQLYFQIGLLHFTLKNFDKMVERLEESIACKQHPAAYNLLAYHYAQENKYLDKALALINIALQKNPSCYYFLDTKGCILLKLGKKQEAKKLFEKALQQAPHDKTLQEHHVQASN